MILGRKADPIVLLTLPTRPYRLPDLPRTKIIVFRTTVLKTRREVGLPFSGNSWIVVVGTIWNSGTKIKGPLTILREPGICKSVCRRSRSLLRVSDRCPMSQEESVIVRGGANPETGYNSVQNVGSSKVNV